MVLFGRIVQCLPLLLAILLPAAFFVTYGIAVSLKHVYPVWPYISDTGTLSPESCVFTVFLHVAGVLLAAIIYVRHLQVRQFTALRPYVRISAKWNAVASSFGYLGVLGLACVASFQETNQFLVHIVGALACFVFSTVYFFIQCIFTYKMRYRSTLIFWLRVFFTCVNAIAFISMFAPVKAAGDAFKGKNVLLWSPKDGGYGYHLISTISEWILAFSLCLYISTFHWEFRGFLLSQPEVQFVETARPRVSADKGRDLEGSISPRSSQWV